MEWLDKSLSAIQVGVQALIPSLLLLTVAVLVLRWLVLRSAEKRRGYRFRDQILGLLIGISTCVGVVITLPVDADVRAQLLTLFGLLLTAIITLASPTIAANAMAGVMVRSLRFAPGDFIQCGEFFGRVTEQNLFHVEIQTADRDLLTIPNVYMASNPVKVVHAGGTLVSAEISLGYEYDHHRIEAVLREAAEAAELRDPFVYVLELGDFSVLYRVAGFLEEVKSLLSVRSRLRACMLDHLHGAGIEIVSPGFMNQRQVNGPVMPQKSAIDAARNSAPGESDDPENLIFDKADRAQQLQELAESAAELKSEISALEKTGPGADELIARKTRRLKATKRAIQYLETEDKSGKKTAPP